MKKYLILLSFFVIGSNLNAGVPFLPTKLKITILNDLGAKIEGASVRVYLSKDDYLNSENSVYESTTDEKGRVQFKDLNPTIYYIEVNKDALNNDGLGSETDKLKEGRVNKVTIVIT